MSTEEGNNKNCQCNGDCHDEHGDQEGCQCGCQCGCEQHEVQDPLAAFIMKWKNTLFTIFVVCACGCMVYQWYQADNFKARQNASDEFEALKNDFRIVTASLVDQSKVEAKDVKAAIERIDSRLSNIVNLQMKAPYLTLSSLYHDILEVRQGKVQDFAPIIARLEAFPNDKVEFKGERLFVEMCELFIAKYQFDIPEKRADGMKLLLELAKESQYVKVQAVQAAARLAGSAEERNEVREVIEYVLKAEPAFSDELELVAAKLK